MLSLAAGSIVAGRAVSGPAKGILDVEQKPIFRTGFCRQNSSQIATLYVHFCMYQI
jgi:hypothetical protein